MSQNVLTSFPEVFLSQAESSKQIQRAVKGGYARQLEGKLYTKNMTDSPASIVKRNLWQIVSILFPGALVADRTALENRASPNGTVFVVATQKRQARLPGLTIVPRRGVPPLESDRLFIDSLYLSSPARAYLENMRPSRTRSTDVSRTCGAEEVERRLEELLRKNGEAELLRLRDEIHARAEELSAQEQAKELDKIIGALLGTRTADLRSATGRARMQGQPFDPDRLELFQSLFEDLQSTSPVIRPVDGLSYGQTTLSFFEAYFSNFIEGTEFQVDDAVDIIFNGAIPENRPEDAHDILGTYRIVSSVDEMKKTPTSSENLLELLQDRHSLIMGGRPDKNPGVFKEKANRAGSTLFVEPDLVVGTLCHGYELYRALPTSFARAVFMMFLISEVHPFDDGNGRLARIMMNAELVSSGEWRIIIPTIYRNNYLSGLKALSQSKRTDALISILDFAQKFTRSIPWNTVESTRKSLEQTNAFRDPGEAEESGVRLRLFTAADTLRSGQH